MHCSRYCCIVQRYPVQLLEAEIVAETVLSGNDAGASRLHDLVRLKEEQVVEVFNALQEAIYFLSLLRVTQYSIHFAVTKEGGRFFIAFVNVHCAVPRLSRVFPCVCRGGVTLLWDC